MRLFFYMSSSIRSRQMSRVKSIRLKSEISTRFWKSQNSTSPIPQTATLVSVHTIVHLIPDFSTCSLHRHVRSKRIKSSEHSVLSCTVSSALRGSWCFVEVSSSLSFDSPSIAGAYFARDARATAFLALPVKRLAKAVGILAAWVV